MITSASNGQIKNVVQLQQKTKARRDQGLFVVEGMKMFREAPKDWIHKVFVADHLYKDIKSELTGYPVEVVTDRIFGQISDTKTPQGILCVMKKPCYDLNILTEAPNPLLVVLEDLQDPGNVGTILRTAEGAGVNGVLVSRNTVDLFHPKVIRATMGSIYRMPFFVAEDMKETIQLLKKANIRVFAAHLRGINSYDEEGYLGGTAFLIGNEGNGLSDELTCQADCLIHIPMEGQVESLNAAMSAGILMYEAGRQRRKKV